MFTDKYFFQKILKIKRYEINILKLHTAFKDIDIWHMPGCIKKFHNAFLLAVIAKKQLRESKNIKKI